VVPELTGIATVAACVVAGGGSLYLLEYLYGQRDRPGASYFMGNIASVAACCFAYGAALLVTESALRIALEVITIASVCFMGPFFLAFGLDYTGRGDLLRGPVAWSLGAVPLATAGLAATNSIHELVWTDAQFGTRFGLSTLTYSFQPWGQFALLFSVGTAAVGSLLLIGAIVSYGPLYRREATAVTLSTVPPSLGVLLWLFGAGPVPVLHLTAPLMVVHVALDAYAFVGTHMFDSNPATQRMAEQSGLDSLSDPVLVLDTEGQIVRTNDRAEQVFDALRSAALPIPIVTALGVDLPTLRDSGEISVGAGIGRTFGVSHSTLTGPGDDVVGEMVVLYDVSRERQREQQLAVLNRILRHNLRNETTVISGHAEMLRETLAGTEQSDQAATIAKASGRLTTIAEKVHTFETVQERDLTPERLSVTDLLAEVEAECVAATTGAAVDWSVPSDELRVRTDSVLVSLLVSNLVENAVVHSEAAEPTVTVTATAPPADSGGVTFEVSDSNDRIPPVEIESLRSGDETPLQHGQGVGLWIVYWCVTKLQGEIEFEYDDGNHVSVTVPDLGE